jgi:hypothetical protein
MTLEKLHRVSRKVKRALVRNKHAEMSGTAGVVVVNVKR